MLDKGESILKLLHLYVDEMNYKGTEKLDDDDGEVSMRYSRDIFVAQDGAHAVRLGVEGNYANGATFCIFIVGIFKIEASESISEEMTATLYQDNTVAIMFPFLRTQLSLLTTQPGISPIIIQPMNIVKLFSEAESESQTDK